MKDYTQSELDDLITCPKRVTEPPRREMKLERGSYRNDFKLESLDGSTEFTVFMRINEQFPENFSIGLTARPKTDSGSFCLLRCNGQHGEHSNIGFDDDHPHFGYHAHRADARMMLAGRLPEAFAEKTEEYACYEEALVHFIRLSNIQDASQYLALQDQLSLNFPEKDMP